MWTVAKSKSRATADFLRLQKQAMYLPHGKDGFARLNVPVCQASWYRNFITKMAAANETVIALAITIGQAFSSSP